MDLNLNFMPPEEDNSTIILSGSYKLAEAIHKVLTPKCKAVIKKFRKKYPVQASEMANVNITNLLIESGPEADAHYLMIYDELIDVFDLPDDAGINEGY